MSIVLGHVVDLDTIETEAQRIPESWYLYIQVCQGISESEIWASNYFHSSAETGQKPT